MQPTHDTAPTVHDDDGDDAASRAPRRRRRAAGEHGDTGGHGGHGDHVAMFRRRFWWSLLLTIPSCYQPHGHGLVRLRARLPRHGLGRAGTGHRHLLLGWLAVPLRRMARGPRSSARDDAAHHHGDHGRLHRVDGHQPRMVRPRLLVGAGGAGHDHAAGSLAGDAGPGPGPVRAGRAGRAAARRGRAGPAPAARSRRCRSRPSGAPTSCSCGPAGGCRPTA